SAWTSIPLDSLLDGLMVLLRFQVVSSNPFYRRPVGPFAFTQKKVRYPREKHALEWLETLPPPLIYASDAVSRTAFAHYVPVNDTPSIKDKNSKPGIVQSIPAIPRIKQPRTFPRVRPVDDTVWFIWPDVDPPEAIRDALDSLCCKVVRVGHSSSLVQAWVAQELNGVVPRWIPDDETAEIRMRVPSRGTLAMLRDRYNAEAIETFFDLDARIRSSQGKDQKEAKAAFREVFGREWKRGIAPPERLRPVLGLWQGYRRVDTEADVPPRETVFDPAFTVLRLEPTAEAFGGRLDLTTTLRLTDVLRAALMNRATELGLDPVPEVITGHQLDGQPLHRPHAAFIPLGFVGREHADGHLLGLALVLPRDAHWPRHAVERRQVLTALARIQTLKLGRLGVWRLVPEVRESPAYNLTPEAWTGGHRGARVWGTVTPIVLDRHPKAESRREYYEEVAAVIRQSCERIGLPTPVSVTTGPVSPHLGVPASHEFPRLERKDGSQRRHTHATIVFEEPVVGPVLLGAGRYRGYGLCRPVREGEVS
ncbi:MAG TPA: type I-U CRISPR-associated protein Csb2, partial [Actinopolymorphaceae bacterium]